MPDDTEAHKKAQQIMIYKDYLSGLAVKISTRDCPDEKALFRKCWKVAGDEIVRRRNEVKERYREKGIEINDRSFEIFNVCHYQLDWAIEQYELCLQKKSKENAKTRKTLTVWGDFATDIYVIKLQLMKQDGNKNRENENAKGVSGKGEANA